MDSLSVLQMVGGKVEELEYKGRRYDENMYHLLKEFKEDGLVKGVQKSDSLLRKKTSAI